jgi:cytoskeletal protein RodZ
MRWFFVRSLAFLAAFAAPLAAQTPTPTPANAVEPSNQSAVAPALPLRAGQPNPEVSLGAPVAAPTPAATPSSAPPELVPLTTKEDTPTVSSPPSSASPAAGSAHARAGVVTAKPVTVSQGAASTVTSYQKGKTLTVKTPAGSLVEYRLGKNTILPADLGPGRQVLVETKIVKKRRVASKVSYAEGRVVLTNVN